MGHEVPRPITTVVRSLFTLMWVEGRIVRPCHPSFSVPSDWGSFNLATRKSSLEPVPEGRGRCIGFRRVMIVGPPFDLNA